MSTPCLHLSEQIWEELWCSFASLLRSYTAAHGLHRNVQAMMEQNEERILVSHCSKHLELMRTGSEVTWKREDGSRGVLEFTPEGRFRGSAGEEEMDMAAEAWARELMQ